MGRPRKHHIEELDPKQEDVVTTSTLEEPIHNGKLGDISPDYISWFGETHSTQEFRIKYIKRRNRVPEESQKYFNW